MIRDSGLLFWAILYCNYCNLLTLLFTYGLLRLSHHAAASQMTDLLIESRYNAARSECRWNRGFASQRIEFLPFRRHSAVTFDTVQCSHRKLM